MEVEATLDGSTCMMRDEEGVRESIGEREKRKGEEGKEKEGSNLGHVKMES